MRRVLTVLLAAGCAIAQQPVYEDARVRITVTQPRPGSAAGLHFSSAAITFVEESQIAIELLAKQTNPRNVCFQVLPGEYLHCHEPGPEWVGANLEIQVETEQTRVGMLRIAPGATLAVPPLDIPPLLIALEGTEAEVVSHANGAPLAGSSRRKISAANVLLSPADQVTEVRNTGKTTARFLLVEFGGPGE